MRSNPPVQLEQGRQVKIKAQSQQPPGSTLAPCLPYQRVKPPKSITLIGAGTSQSSRDGQDQGKRTRASQGGASRTILFWLVCGLDSPCWERPVPHRRGFNVGYAARATITD